MLPFWNLTEILQIGFVASPRQSTKGGSVSVVFFLMPPLTGPSHPTVNPIESAPIHAIIS